MKTKLVPVFSLTNEIIGEIAPSKYSLETISVPSKKKVLLKTL